MLKGNKIIVVMPAYNSAATLKSTYGEIPFDIVDDVILVDDASNDKTVEVARQLGIKSIFIHKENRGYGANQKTCYDKALESGADIVVMLHPDYQYTPLLIHSMVYMIVNGVYPVVLGSRILGKGAVKGGMPRYKYIANRFLTLVQNLLMNQKLSEYHTGFRAYKADILKEINYHDFSDDFIFDNQVIAAIFAKGYEIGEMTCPTHYSEQSSSINFARSVKYGLGVLKVSVKYFFGKI
jgi:glycosyltransferase involved in cell wall biosynthesis